MKKIIIILSAMLASTGLNAQEKNTKPEPVDSVHLFLQPVEIRAIRAPEKSPFTKQNLKAGDLAKNNLGQDLPFLLNQTPSVVIHSDAGNGVGYSGIRIRGTDPTRINFTLNGIPYNDAESQGVFFVNLPDFSSSVSSLQIQRGVGTSSNGTGAFGATINMSTHDFREKAYAEFDNSFGSFNTRKHTLKVGSGLLSKHFTLDARLSTIQSDGYIDRASSDLKSYYTSLAYFNKKSSIRLNIFSGTEKTYQAWYGVHESLLEDDRTYNPAGTEKPGEPYDNETDNYRQDHAQLFFNHALSKKWNLNAALFHTKGKGYYEQYKAEQSFSNYGLPDFITGMDTLSTTDLIRQLWLDNRFYGGIFSAQFKDEKTEFLMGGGWNRYDGNHFGKIIWAQWGVPDQYKWYDLDAQKTDFNIYSKWQRKLNKQLQIFVDLQYRYVDYDLEGFRNNPELFIQEQYHFFNPKLGITYSQNNWLAYASYAIGNKEPNRDDFEAGPNQVPKPENLQDFEAGLEKRMPGFSYGITAFYMKYKDQLVLTGKINDVGAYARTNIPESYRAGLEVQGAWKPFKWMQASGNISWSSNKIIDFIEYYDDYDNGGQKEVYYEKTDISFSPDWVGAGSINFYPARNLEISWLVKYVSSQFLDNTSNTSRKLDSYFLNDMRLLYTLKAKPFREIVFNFSVQNIFNVKYEPNGYTYSYQYGGVLTTENFFYPMAGINFLGGISIKI